MLTGYVANNPRSGEEPVTGVFLPPALLPAALPLFKVQVRSVLNEAYRTYKQRPKHLVVFNHRFLRMCFLPAGLRWI